MSCALAAVVVTLCTRQLCNERGLLLIHDQVQAGLNIPDKVFSPQHRDSVLSH